MFFCFFKTCSWQDIHLGWAWTTSTRTNELGYTHTRNPSRFSTKGEENWNTFGETRMYPVQMNGTNLKRCLLRSFCLFIHSNWMSKCSATIETCPLPVVCNKRLYSLKDGSLCPIWIRVCWCKVLHYFCPFVMNWVVWLGWSTMNNITKTPLALSTTSLYLVCRVVYSQMTDEFSTEISIPQPV